MVVLTNSAQQQIKGTEIDSGTLDGGEGAELQHLQSQPGREPWEGWEDNGQVTVFSHIYRKSGNTQADHGADDSCMHNLGEAGGSIQ